MSRTASRIVWVLVPLLLSCWACGGAQATPKDVGLAIGTPAPKFLLRDQGEAERSLDSLIERGTVAIVFFRSADW